MSRLGTAVVLLGLSLGSNAGVMDSDWSCRMYSKVYGFALEDLAKLDHRDPFYRAPHGPNIFATALATPVGIANDFHAVIYGAALPAQLQDIADVVACGRKHDCTWAKPEVVAAETGGHTLPEGSCPN